MKVLFILKKNLYGYSSAYNSGYGTSGLLNSSKFIVDMLVANGVAAKEVIVQDNNDIDREVHNYKPDVVVIEALWVVPEKFDVLRKLHPSVTWIVRVHSDFPFLAMEGIAMQWLFAYIKNGVNVAFNKLTTAEAFSELNNDQPGVVYLPNYYPLPKQKKRDNLLGLNIGCFGAIRPFKDQLTQAIAAIRYADSVGKPLRFYVNATRCEQGGDSVLKNLRALFKNTQHTLEECPWSDHDEFLGLLSMLDLAMCVSFTETFCITAADAVAVGTPLLCSNQVPWASSISVVTETDTETISKKIGELLGFQGWLSKILNHRNLHKYSEKSQEIWLNLLNGI